MTLVSENVAVAVTGGVSVGTVAAAAPTDADTALGVGWTDLGYISEAGVVEGMDRSVNKIKAWQNASIVRVVVTEALATFKVTFIESKQDVVELYYAAAVDGDGAVVVDPSLTGGRQKFVIDVIDDDEHVRIYIPQGELSDAPEAITNASGDPIAYGVTISAYPDSSLGGSFKKFYKSMG